MTTGQRIRKLRRDRDWTQAELGERSGVYFRNISRYESDRLKPGVKILQRLAVAFEVSVEELMDRQEAGPLDTPLQDRELLRYFQAVEQMDDEDRAAVKRLLQAMVIKQQVQSLGRSA